MKKFLIFSLLLIFQFQFVNSQPLDSLWMYYYGQDSISEYAYDVVLTYDSGYLVVGKRYSGWPGKIEGAIIISIDKDGQLIWDKNFSTSNHDDFQSIITTYDSNFVAGGNLSGLAWLIKMDINGDTLWTKSYGDNFGGITSVQELMNNELVITGNAIGYGQSYDFYLMKINQYGDTIWTHKYNYEDNYVRSYCVKQTFDGGFIISAGYSTMSFVNIPIILKTGINGDTLWSIHNIDSDAKFPEILVDVDTIYFIGSALRYKENKIAKDAILIKMKSDGEIIWIKDYGEPTSMEMGYSFTFTNSGNILIVGENSNESGNIYTFETDKNGELIWEKSYVGNGMSHIPFSVKTVYENNYIITGISNTKPFLFKLGEKPSGINCENEQIDIRLRVSPNPVKSTATIDFVLDQKELADISIYSFNGEKISQIIKKQFSKGNHKLYWETSSLQSGIYFVKMKSGNSVVVKKIIHL
ncbi:MAG: hypothetical protein B6D61_06780 [Bacteroidetes bacterium 4484_249]|nr:MAG: hypothetical protein B6D61_06780 [Bacteroidetes bacterium 4484_249]